MNELVDRLKALVVAHLVTKAGLKNVAQSPFLDIIVVLLPVLLDLLANCSDDPAKNAAVSNNPDLVVRWQLRFLLLDHVPGLDRDSVRMRHHLFEALLSAGKTMTASDFASIAA